MIDLLSQAVERSTATGNIGFVIMAIIVGPVIAIILASMFGSPRTLRMPGLFLGSLIILVGALISGFAIIGLLLRFVVPQ
jgi:hypothetical protein